MYEMCISLTFNRNNYILSIYIKRTMYRHEYQSFYKKREEFLLPYITSYPACLTADIIT